MLREDPAGEKPQDKAQDNDSTFGNSTEEVEVDLLTANNKDDPNNVAKKAGGKKINLKKLLKKKQSMAKASKQASSEVGDPETIRKFLEFCDQKQKE